MLLMSQSFKTKEFKQLKDKWYKKLAKAGFTDIEQDEDNLHKWDSFRFIGDRTKSNYQYNPEYFTLASLFLDSHKFKTSRDLKIWTLHAEGKTIREIVKILKEKRIKSCRAWVVFSTVKRLRELMFIKRKEEDQNE